MDQQVAKYLSQLMFYEIIREDIELTVEAMYKVYCLLGIPKEQAIIEAHRFGLVKASKLSTEAQTSFPECFTL